MNIRSEKCSDTEKWDSPIFADTKIAPKGTVPFSLTRKLGQSPKTRRGVTLVELAVAAGMLGALLVVCLQLLAATAAQRRAADQRQLAIFEAANVLERIAARPWSDLTPQALAAEKPSAAALEGLPEAELQVEVKNPSAEPNAKRITVSLRWQDRDNRFLPPVKITTWRYKRD